LVVDQGKDKNLKRPSGSRLKAREGTGWVVLVLVMHLGAREIAIITIIAIVVVLITDS
jgi:multidrug efflux pump subunit AcrB